jgi:hypothetical protein
MDMGQTMSLVRWICQAGALGKRVGGFFERAGMYKFFTVLKRVKGGCRFNVDNQVEREKITFWRVLSGIPYLTILFNQGIPDNLFEQKKVTFHLERPY